MSRSHVHVSRISDSQSSKSSRDGHSSIKAMTVTILPNCGLCLRFPTSAKTSKNAKRIKLYFGGQIRGDLILSKYNSALFRRTVKRSTPLFGFRHFTVAGNAGLAAHNGSLIDARHGHGALFHCKPVQATTSAMDVKSVFSRRERLFGGSKLFIFGVQLCKFCHRYGR